MNENKPKLYIIENTNQFWLHYISLEKSIGDISEYIAIHEDNYQTYSFKNMQLYFAVCSEIDSIFKHIRANIGNDVDKPKKNSDNPNIVQHKDMINKYFSKIKKTKVVLDISGFDLEFQPFGVLFDSYQTKQASRQAGTYEEKDYQGWWEDYNAVKHQRLESFRKANLNNLLNSLSALHILNLIYVITLRPESEWINNYDSILIEAPATYHYPFFRVKGGGVSHYIGGGFNNYRCYLDNEHFYSRD